jgi:hypothetical protein
MPFAVCWSVKATVKTNLVTSQSRLATPTRHPHLKHSYLLLLLSAVEDDDRLVSLNNGTAADLLKSLQSAVRPQNVADDNHRNFPGASAFPLAHEAKPYAAHTNDISEHIQNFIQAGLTYPVSVHVLCK